MAQLLQLIRAHAARIAADIITAALFQTNLTMAVHATPPFVSRNRSSRCRSRSRLRSIWL